MGRPGLTVGFAIVLSTGDGRNMEWSEMVRLCRGNKGVIKGLSIGELARRITPSLRLS